MNWSEFVQEAQSFLIQISKSLLLAAAVLVFGVILVRFLRRNIAKAMDKRKWDPSLESFMLSVISAFLYGTLIIAVITILGVPASSFIAILGSAGLAIGLALQGSLSNIAGGVLLVVLKPLRVGDYVDIAGAVGTVEGINLFYTHLVTPDNQVLHIPNGKLANSNILNFSQRDTRRITIQVRIAYASQVAQAKEVLKALMDADERILKDPASKVVVMNLGETAVELTMWAWVKRTEFGDVMFSLRESTKRVLQESNISIPFPQQDVHIIQK